MAFLSAHTSATDAAGAISEAEVVARARLLEAEAWELLYGAHYQAIFRYLFYRLRDVPAAEDLAGEVFLEAVKGIQKYQYRGVSFRAWLYRIAHNIAADFRRKAIARGAHEAPRADEHADLPAADFAPALLQHEDLVRALHRLTDEQQQVIILRFMEGCSLAETGQAMGRPAGAIKSLQHRALGRLRKLLDEEAAP